MNADFQLRHLIVGRHGSFWGAQADAVTKDRLRSIARVGGMASRLQHIDVTAAYAAGNRSMLMEEVTFPFIDGNFATVSSFSNSFDLFETLNADNHPVHTLTRNVGTGSNQNHAMSLLTPAEAAAMLDEIGAVSQAANWYVIPKPEWLNPLTLSTTQPGVTLVAGVDFFSFSRSIVTRENPAEIFTPGAITAQIAEVMLDTSNSFVADAPRDRLSQKWLSIYAKRAQSMELFRRAAAEYCGLLVLPEDDALLAVKQAGTSWVYAFANLGVVKVDYMHSPLTVGQTFRQGYIVHDMFEIRNKDTHDSGFINALDFGVSIEGITGKDLRFSPGVDVGLSTVEYAPTGAPILRLYFSGSQQDHDAVWAFWRANELMSGNFLSDALGYTSSDFLSGALSIDFGSLIEEFYGPRLQVLTCGEMSDPMFERLKTFVRNHKPIGNIVLISANSTPADDFLAVETPATLSNLFMDASPLMLDSYPVNLLS